MSPIFNISFFDLFYQISLSWGFGVLGFWGFCESLDCSGPHFGHVRRAAAQNKRVKWCEALSFIFLQGGPFGHFGGVLLRVQFLSGFSIFMTLRKWSRKPNSVWSKVLDYEESDGDRDFAVERPERVKQDHFWGPFCGHFSKIQQKTCREALRRKNNQIL